MKRSIARILKWAGVTVLMLGVVGATRSGYRNDPDNIEAAKGSWSHISDLTSHSPSNGELAYTDSKQELQAFSGTLQRLYEAGKLTEMDVLTNQLSRRICNVELSETREAVMNPARLYEQKNKAVVVVGYLYNCGHCKKWHASFATGFLVTSNGVMITNYHVVGKPKIQGLGVMTYDGNVYPVKEVLAADKASDVAVLQLEGSNFPYLSLLPGKPIGSKVWAISNPSENLRVFTDGIISSRLVTTRNGALTQRISITADFGQGSSGAPVFEESGRVVGMVASTVAVRPGQECSSPYAQMVMRHCIPAELILELFADGAKPSRRTEAGGASVATSKHSCTWFTSYEEAKAEAEMEGKKLFVLFSDSEFCPPCRGLKAKVLTSETFLDYAKDRLVLFKADKALERKDKTGTLARQNEMLMEKYPHKGVPWIFITHKSGAVIGRTGGYLGEGPEEYIEERLQQYVD